MSEATERYPRNYLDLEATVDDDAEKIAEDIQRRHARLRNEILEVQHDGPTAMIYSLPVKPSYGDAAVRIIEGHIESLSTADKVSAIRSVQQLQKFPEQVFVWAHGLRELEELTKEYTFLYHSRITTIEPEEWLRLCTSLDDVCPAPSWVRVKGGVYNHDLALVELSHSPKYIDVLLVPRLLHERKNRPVRCLIPQAQAVAAWGRRSIKAHPSEPHWFTHHKTLIKHGLHSHTIVHSKLTPTLPKDLSEVTPFLESALIHGLPDPLRTFVIQTTDEIKTADILATFRPRDHVTIVPGSFASTRGRIREVLAAESAVITLESVDTEGRDIDIGGDVTVPLKELRRVFKVGDHIRVVFGAESGRQGIIVEVDGPLLTLSEHTLSHNTKDWSKNDALARSLYLPVYSCNVEFYEPDRKLHSYLMETQSPEQCRDLPTVIGQQAEVILGPYRGCRGYVQGWDADRVKLRLYFRSTPSVPSMPRQQGDYPAPENDVIFVPVQFIARCFIEGDIVFKADTPKTRFLVRHDDRIPDDQPLPIHPQHIRISWASYNRKISKWEVNKDAPFSLVPRDSLVMLDVIHDPDIAWSVLNYIPSEEGLQVTVTSGPFKGYHGRIRKIWRDDVEVDLEALQKIVKLKPQVISRLVNNVLIRNPINSHSASERSTIQSAGVQLSPAPGVGLDSHENIPQTPLPTLLSPGQRPIEPAWDPHSRTLGSSARITDAISAGGRMPGASESVVAQSSSINESSLQGSPWLLRSVFQVAMRQYSMLFTITGTKPNFHKGIFEGATARTAKEGKRNSEVPGEGQVLVLIGFLRPSLASVPVQFLCPQLAGPGDSAVIIEGHLAGCFVTVQKKPLPDNSLTVIRPDTNLTLIYPPTALVKTSYK